MNSTTFVMQINVIKNVFQMNIFSLQFFFFLLLSPSHSLFFYFLKKYFFVSSLLCVCVCVYLDHFQAVHYNFCYNFNFFRFVYFCIYSLNSFSFVMMRFIRSIHSVNECQTFCISGYFQTNIHTERNRVDKRKKMNFELGNPQNNLILRSVCLILSYSLICVALKI